jgi:guanylate kinase
VPERSLTGQLVVISAPSGTGKSTVAQALLRSTPGMEFSVSYATRPRRPGERDGREYHFVDRTSFDAMIERQEFLEWADVYGQRYGTGREATLAALAAGRLVLLDIDVQGAEQVRRSGVPCTTIMLLPPDFRTLETRLRGRGSEPEADLGARLAQARHEVARFRDFDYVVVNDDVALTTETVRSIVRAEGARSGRRAERVAAILATFPER